MFISLSNGNGSAFENSLDSGRISFRKRPCAMYKDNAVGNVVKEMGRDLVFGTTARLSDLSKPLTGEVRRSPELSPRPSAAAESEERQICKTCLFAGTVGLCLCFLPSRGVQRQRCWKRGSGDGQRLSLYDYGSTERSFNAVDFMKGEVRRSPEQSARQPIARSGKFVWRAYSRRALDCEKKTVLCFLPSWAHFCLRGFGGRGEIWRGSPQWNTKEQLPKPQTATFATAQRPK